MYVAVANVFRNTRVEGVRSTCSQCKATGHNRRTCPLNRAAVETEEDELSTLIR